MSLTDISDRDAVLKAIEEFDDLGRSNFLEKYGFSEAKEFFLRFKGSTIRKLSVELLMDTNSQWGPESARFSGGKETVKKP